MNFENVTIGLNYLTNQILRLAPIEYVIKGANKIYHLGVSFFFRTKSQEREESVDRNDRSFAGENSEIGEEDRASVSFSRQALRDHLKNEIFFIENSSSLPRDKAIQIDAIRNIARRVGVELEELEPVQTNVWRERISMEWMADALSNVMRDTLQGPGHDGELPILHTMGAGITYSILSPYLASFSAAGADFLENLSFLDMKKVIPLVCDQAILSLETAKDQPIHTVNRAPIPQEDFALLELSDEEQGLAIVTEEEFGDFSRMHAMLHTFGNKILASPMFSSKLHLFFNVDANDTAGLDRKKTEFFDEVIIKLRSFEDKYLFHLGKQIESNAFSILLREGMSAEEIRSKLSKNAVEQRVDALLDRVVQQLESGGPSPDVRDKLLGYKTRLEQETQHLYFTRVGRIVNEVVKALTKNTGAYNIAKHITDCCLSLLRHKGGVYFQPIFVKLVEEILENPNRYTVEDRNTASETETLLDILSKDQVSTLLAEFSEFPSVESRSIMQSFHLGAMYYGRGIGYDIASLLGIKGPKISKLARPLLDKSWVSLNEQVFRNREPISSME